MQQYRYSLKKQGGIFPREMLLNGLQIDIPSWKEKGDGIIVVGDFNEDVCSTVIAYWKDRNGLYDVKL